MNPAFREEPTTSEAFFFRTTGKSWCVQRRCLTVARKSLICLMVSIHGFERRPFADVGVGMSTRNARRWFVEARSCSTAHPQTRDANRLVERPRHNGLASPLRIASTLQKFMCWKAWIFVGQHSQFSRCQTSSQDCVWCPS